MAAINNWRFNPENKKNLFILMGFVMGLSFVFIVLEWSKAENMYVKSADDWILVEPVDLPPITTTDVPLPPPPPKIVLSGEYNEIPNDVPLEATQVLRPEPTTGETNHSPVLIEYNGPAPEDEPTGIPAPLDFADEMPEFYGNVFEYLSKNIHYPPIAQEEGIQGKVYCQFVVNMDGTIVDAKVMTPVHPSLDKEALKVINGMPKWKPGKQKGKAVRVKFILPVNFRLM